MENKDILKNLGLDEHESNIYLALLRLGVSRASVIAKDVGLKRTTVYPILKTLASRSFVKVYFRKNTRFYYAQKPARVAAIFEKKLESFESIIPNLETIEKKQASLFGLRFIETMDELKEFYAGVLDEYKNKDYLIIGSAPAWEGLDPKFFIKYRKDRAKNKIRTKLILSSESKDINPEEKELLREYKYLPAKYKFKSTVDIFDDKILVVSPELASLAVVIAVPAMVDVFKSVFDMLWDTVGLAKK